HCMDRRTGMSGYGVRSAGYSAVRRCERDRARCPHCKLRTQPHHTAAASMLRGRAMRPIAVSLWAVLIALPFGAQEKLVETIDVRIVNVDVVVTDRSGKPVTGLTK